MTFYWDVIFHLGLTDTLFLYIKIAKLSLLGYYLSFGSNRVFCQVEENYKKAESFGILKIVRSQRSLKDLDCFEQVGSSDSNRNFDNHRFKRCAKALKCNWRSDMALRAEFYC